jgi:Holliday junction DNA helicase RuvA
MAMAILSVLAPDPLRRAIATGDAEALATAPGVGRKVAARIILDLKDTVGIGDEVAAGGPLAEVREALLALGLSPQEAREAIGGLTPNGDGSVEGLLRQALRSVGR